MKSSNLLLNMIVIELLILVLLLVLYYTVYFPEEHKAICLLGTYIISKIVLTTINYFIKKK